jgi:hypothetical protein
MVLAAANEPGFCRVFFARSLPASAGEARVEAPVSDTGFAGSTGRTGKTGVRQIFREKHPEKLSDTRPAPRRATVPKLRSHKKNPARSGILR